jgi:REP element-mobilizing transposase RayT
MGKTLGYMITWTTYGTWLQGDERGYVKNGKIYPANKALKKANESSQSTEAVLLSTTEKQIVKHAIIKEAALQGQKIYALSVCSNHVHIVAGYIEKPISKIVAYYKKAARLALKTAGRGGKVWTRGYDKRFCFDQRTLKQKIKYVQDHDE